MAVDPSTATGRLAFRISSSARRRAASGCAWFVGLLRVPYVALRLDMIFGARKVGDPRHPAGGQAHPARIAGDPESPEVHLRKLAAAMSLPGAATYRQLAIHQDGAQALEALNDLIDGAARTLEICTFILGKDAVGRGIAERLESRARDGVRVRLLVDGIENAVSTLPALRHMGVTLSIDAFGTGYSSLSYLKRFPITAVKIDQSFVRGVTSDANDAAIALSVIGIGRSLGLRVTAEGVETEGQLEFLRANRCDEIQGFHFARPMDAAATAEFLRRRRRR